MLRMDDKNQHKHEHEPESLDECRAKRPKSDDSDTDLSKFLEWCKSNDLFIDYEKVIYCSNLRIKEKE